MFTLDYRQETGWFTFYYRLFYYVDTYMEKYIRAGNIYIGMEPPGCIIYIIGVLLHVILPPDPTKYGVWRPTVENRYRSSPTKYKYRVWSMETDNLQSMETDRRSRLLPGPCEDPKVCICMYIYIYIYIYTYIYTYTYIYICI